MNIEVEQTMEDPPNTFCLRFPTRNGPELFISYRGKSYIFPLTLNQMKLLSYQSAQGIIDWEEPKEG